MIKPGGVVLVAPSDGEFRMVLDMLQAIQARLKDIEDSQTLQRLDTAERKGAANMIRGLCLFLGMTSLPSAFQGVMWVLSHVHFQ